MTYPEYHSEKELRALEKKLQALYKTAEKELARKTQEYKDRFEQRYLEQHAAYKSGHYTEKQFQEWFESQISRGHHWNELKKEAARMLTETNVEAAAMINGSTSEVAKECYNYSAYEIENYGPQNIGGMDAGISFNLANEHTVKGLAQAKIDLSKDEKWNTERIHNAMLQGIIQGESIGQMANRLQYGDQFGGFDKRVQGVAQMNRTSAIRNARTFMTCAQGYGCQKSMEDAEAMGIEMQKEWIAYHDTRTRDSHRMLDGIRVPVKERFPNGLLNPGDADGRPEERYNCRCTMRSVLPGINDSERDIYHLNKDGKWEIKKGTTTVDDYKKWKEDKAAKQKPFTYADATHERDGRFFAISKKTSEVIDLLDNDNIKYKRVRKRLRKLNTQEIIDAVGGKDLTSGSCSSVALAYAGQKGGLDVYDFRGGKSLDYFSRTSIVRKIANNPKFTHIENTAMTEIESGIGLIKKLESGKEYYFACGGHAAIVKKFYNGTPDGELKYLELQDGTNNGWYKFTDDISTTLKKRFMCDVGTKVSLDSFAIELNKEFTESEDLRELLGYINTNKKKQRKI